MSLRLIASRYVKDPKALEIFRDAERMVLDAIETCSAAEAADRAREFASEVTDAWLAGKPELSADDIREIGRIHDSVLSWTATRFRERCGR